MFKKTAIGLDISDQTIEVAQVEKTAHGFKAIGLSRVSLDPGVVVKGKIVNQEKLVKAVEQAFQNAKPKPITATEVVFALPESQTYIHNFKTKGILGKNDLSEAINLEVKRSIPLQFNDVVYSYQLLQSSKTEAEYIVVAASKAVVMQWQELFNKLKIKIDFFDIEALAIFRGVFNKKNPQPVCIVDIGQHTTHIGLFTKNGLCLSYTVELAGQHLTEHTAKEMKVDIETAESKKKDLEVGKMPDKSRVDLNKIVDKIIIEVQKSLIYYEDKTGLKVEKIVLVGNSSRLKGLDKYFTEKLSKETVIAQSDLLKKGEILEFVEPIGLAMRDLVGFFKDDPKIPLLDMKKYKKDNSQQLEEKTVTTESKLVDSADTVVEDKTDFEPDTKKKIVTLVIVLVVGFALIITAFWYRQYSSKQKLIKVQKMTEQLDKNLKK